MACPTCNRTLKSDEFPVAGRRGIASQSSTALDALELPLLLFPFRDDPSKFIDFFGATPQIRPKSGHEQNRARTTIEFFRLADEMREELYMQRFAVIRELFSAYSNIKKQFSPETLESDQKLIRAFTSERAMHTACARAYLDLLEKDFASAYKIREQAVKAVIDKSILPN